MMSTPRSFCASIMSWPLVHNDVADPCQSPPPSPRQRAPAGIRDATASPVDWRVGVEQEGHEVRDLLLGQDAVVAEARHVGAGRERLGIVDLAIGVLLDRLARATLLAELVEARTDGAERQLLLRELVAVVAASARRPGRGVGELPAHAAFRHSLFLAPVAHGLSGARVADGLLLWFFDPVAHAFG